MNAKQRTMVILILVMSLIISGCGFAQSHTPTPRTITKATVIPTLTPTSTPMPTSTPIPTPTLQFFAIQDESFQDYQRDCETDISVTSVDGDSLGITVNTTISILNDGLALFCYGAKHTWIGTLTYAGYTFASDEKDPLKFTVDASQGYLYTGGKGTVTSPDGSATNFGGGEAAAMSPDAESENTPSSPAENGIPVITSVEQRRDASSSGLVIFQDISFQDSDGDVTRVDYEVVSTTASDVYVEGGTIDISRAEQKAGAMITGQWGCGNETYEVTLRVTLTDELGNVSEPDDYTMVCGEAPSAAPADWNGIPIMTYAEDAGEYMGDYQFTIKAPVDEVEGFYKIAMQDLGWKLRQDMMVSIPTDLAFEKGGTFAFFKITPDGDNNTVMIHMVQQ